MGLSHTAIAPYDAYPTSDGQMLIGVQNDTGWRTLVTEVLDAPELADDPRFATNVDRVQNRVACDALVGAQTRRWTTAELDARLAAAGVPAAQVKRTRPGGGPSAAARARSLADDRHRERRTSTRCCRRPPSGHRGADG